MGYIHSCLFCGWSRPSAAATILDPGCEKCGCVLISSPRRPAEPTMPDLGAEAVFPPVVGWLAKGAAVIAVMVAGTVAGYNAGGPWIAGVGFSLAGLISVPPLVPQRF